MQSQNPSPSLLKSSLKQSDHPQLLVSVRNLAEAKIAVTAGCDLLDIKEPQNGPLGMQRINVINKITEFAKQEEEIASLSKTFPLISAALGEVIEWEFKIGSVAVPSELSFLKLGLCCLGKKNRMYKEWVSRWMTVRHRIEKGFSKSSPPPQWIAVAYADVEEANSPTLQEILEAAIATNCAGFLIDTFAKDGSTLFDSISEKELTELSLRAKEHHLMFAVAGSLREETLPLLVPVNPDIIGIRSAACCNQSRTEEISQQAIQNFQTTLLKTFQKN
ncbi:hypothetical protein MNBD_PLANCTO02-179 [hydrothermal vent metagenome]|uniref:(5-formylfuran-3-yl)methyl phosphate synthase n=1 Tax=hydrothermal vent metagenome TaxID=652676 RepID=A0A3B1E0C4_9ZZZZ